MNRKTAPTTRRKTRWRIAAMALALWSGALAASEPPRIGLVLGGGGARGAAHIGVLKVLERERIPIHAIAGTSIGAIIGGLYAAGHSPEEIEIAVSSIDWVDIFRDPTARPDTPMRQKETDLGNVANFEVGIAHGELAYPSTLVRGQKLGLFLRKNFLGRSQVDSFDDLPIPFRCVATDIGEVRPRVFSSGDLELAIRASMAVPGAFAPVHHEGKVLVDGGIVNNLPVDVARSMGVDVLIVVDVGQPLAAPETVDSTFEILLQMVSGLMRDRSDAALATLGPNDVFIQPDLGEIGSASFVRANDAVAPGKRAAEAALDKLRVLSLPEEQYLAWRARQHRPLSENPRVEFVHVDDSQSRTAEFVRDRVGLEAGKELDTRKLERDIAGAFGRGTYDSISYRLAKDENGRQGVEVTPVDSSLGRLVFRAGLQINDDFEGTDDYQLNLEGRLTGLNSKGAEWRTFLGIGRVASIATDFYLPFGERGNWFATPEIGYAALNQPLIIDGIDVAQYRVESWLGSLRVGRDFGDRFRLSAALLRGEDRAVRQIGSPDLPERSLDDIGGVGVNLLWDSLDNVRFPRRGLRAEIGYNDYRESMGAHGDGDLLRVAIDDAMSFGRNTLMLGGRASLSKQPLGAFQTTASLGGLTFLSGLRDRELLGNQMVLVRGIYYRRLSQQGLLFDVPTYIAASVEGGNVWMDYDQVSLGDLHGAASVFFGVDLPIGPLQIGYGRTFDDNDAFYLTFGSLVLPRYR
jgi:NTE family protein